MEGEEVEIKHLIQYAIRILKEVFYVSYNFLSVLSWFDCKCH